LDEIPHASKPLAESSQSSIQIMSPSDDFIVSDGKSEIEQESDVSDESSAKESDDEPGNDENDLQHAPIPALPSSPGHQTVEVGRSDEEDTFSLVAPKTRAGRKRKARDIGAILAVCNCGERVSEDDSDAYIACKRAGCETRLVRLPPLDDALSTNLCHFQYHLHCVGFEYHVRNWICEACDAGARQGGKRQRCHA
jgi:hypothetical protein